MYYDRLRDSNACQWPSVSFPSSSSIEVQSRLGTSDDGVLRLLQFLKLLAAFLRLWFLVPGLMILRQF